MDQNPQGTNHGAEPGTGSGQRQRRFGATRVLPRIEVGRPRPPEVPPPASLTPEILEPGTSDNISEQEMGAPFGGRGGADPFGPRTFAGGRVRVYGCSPGCLIASLIVSFVLTLLLNALI